MGVDLGVEQCGLFVQVSTGFLCFFMSGLLSVAGWMRYSNLLPATTHSELFLPAMAGVLATDSSALSSSEVQVADVAFPMSSRTSEV